MGSQYIDTWKVSFPILIALVFNLNISSAYAAVTASADIGSCDGTDISGKVFLLSCPLKKA